MSESIFNQWRQEEIATARKRLLSIGKNPDQLEGFVDLIAMDTEKKTLKAALAILEYPVAEELIDQLIPLIAHPDADIRATAFSLVAITLKEKGTDFYVRCLEEPKFRDKTQAIYRIYRYGNEAAVPAVAKRLRQILSTRKGSPYHLHNGETELTHCLDFLHHHRECKEVGSVFQRMIDKWEMLSDQEVYWITDQLEYFNHLDLRRERHCLPAVVKLVDSNHPVFQACENGNVEILRKLLDAGVSVYSNDTNRNLSTLALKNDHLEILKLLVEYGLNLERPTHGFRSFLILEALKSARLDFADYILAQGIDLNRYDEYGTSLFNTACCGFVPPEWIARMIALGGDVNDCRFRGETPLFSAARAEATAVMEVLVGHGANINAVDITGKTPLITSAQGGRVESVKWLIAHGADTRHCEERNRDALYWARENNHPKVEELLIRALGGK